MTKKEKVKEIRLWWAFVQNTRIIGSIVPFGSIPQNGVQVCKTYDGNNISSNVLNFRGVSNRTKTFNACPYYTTITTITTITITITITIHPSPCRAVQGLFP